MFLQILSSVILFGFTSLKAVKFSTKKLDISQTQERRFLENLDIYEVIHFNTLSSFIKHELSIVDSSLNITNPKDSRVKQYEKNLKKATKIARQRMGESQGVSAEYHLRWPSPFEIFNLSVYNNKHKSLELSNLHETLEIYCMRFYNEFKHQLISSDKSQVGTILYEIFNINPNTSTMLFNDKLFKFQSYLYSINALHVTKDEYLSSLNTPPDQCEDNDNQCKDNESNNVNNNDFIPSEAFFMTEYEYTALKVLKYDIFECITAFFDHTRKLEDLPINYRNRDMREELINDLFIWIGVHSNGSYHAPHAHQDSMISGSYYVKIPESNDYNNNEVHDPESGRFLLHDPRGSIWPFGLNLPITPTSGQLFLFPSWIKHHVAPTIGSNPRIAMSFNTPGNWKALTNMEKVVNQGLRQRV